MVKSSSDENDEQKERNSSGPNGKHESKRKPRNKRTKQPDIKQSAKQQTKQPTIKQSSKPQTIEKSDAESKRDDELLHRITQLESLAATQVVELRKLREECTKLRDEVESFSQVVDILRQAGLSKDSVGSTTEDESSEAGAKAPGKTSLAKNQIRAYEAYDDADIFGTAPSSVIDAADAAGASILAAILGGKQRMLVDVRDAELSRDPDVLVQFIELSIFPVAAGLEGLKTMKNRVKIVFPTVSQLMQYKRTMVLSAPEVVALSTLGFDPVEKKDNLVVIIAPSPDDQEGLAAMNELLVSPSLRQPVVVLNHHMVPLLGPGGDFEPVYHLRLLSVQYMTGDTPPPEWEKKVKEKSGNSDKKDGTTSGGNEINEEIVGEDIADAETETKEDAKEDAELEAAMEHAYEQGIHQGVTRAMVIRAYPRPWHVFVDTSPDSDADFEVAATFDECPSPDDVNFAIVECLEGSEREDELVAQQMQEALEAGQLNAVTAMLGIPNIDIVLNIGIDAEDDEDDEDDDYNDWDPWGTDTV